MLRNRLEILGVVCLLWLACSVSVAAAGLNFISAAEFKEMLDTNQPIVIADIQKSNNFRKHHFYAAVETDAYPVKTDSQRKQLEKIIAMFEKTGNPIVIVGPRGTSGAKRACEYLLDQDIPQEKIFILEGGIKAWPYKEMLIDIAGGCA